MSGDSKRPFILWVVNRKRLSRAAWACGLIAILLLAAGCGSNPEEQKQRLLELGNKYFERGQFDEASIIYRKAIQVDRRFAEAYYRLGLTLLELRRWDAAGSVLRRAFELDPSNLDAFRKLAELHVLALTHGTGGNREETLRSLMELQRQAEERNPQAMEVLLIKGQILAFQGELEEALALFRRAHQEAPDDPAVSLALAAATFRQGAVQEAEKIARDYLGRHPEAEQFYDFLYLLYAAQGDRDRGEAVLKEKCSAVPENPRNWLALAVHYHAVGKLDDYNRILEKVAGDSQAFPGAKQLVGDLCLLYGEVERALTYYRAGLAEEQDEGIRRRYRYRIVQALLAAGRSDAALEEAEAVLAEDPDDGTALGLRGLARLQKGSEGDREEALADLRTAIASVPEDYMLRFHYGRALLAAGDLVNAEAQFREAVRINPQYLPARYALIDLHIRNGEFSLAEAACREILKSRPFEPEARLRLVQAHIGRREFEKAREELARLADAPGMRLQTTVLAAQMDLLEGKWRSAQRGFQSVLAADPGNLQALEGLTELLARRGRLPDARPLIEKALEAEPDNIALMMAGARLAMRLEQLDRAESYLRRILERQPGNGEAHVLLARIAARRGDREAVRRELQAAVKATPPVAQAFSMYGSVLAEETRYEEARPYLERSLELDPENPLALNNLAFVLAELGTDLDRALTLAQKATSLLPDNPDLTDTLALVYIRRRLNDNAITLLRELTAKYPERAAFRYHLGLAYHQNGDREQARREFKAALAAGLDQRAAAHARKLLAELGG